MLQCCCQVVMSSTIPHLTREQGVKQAVERADFGGGRGSSWVRDGRARSMVVGDGPPASLTSYAPILRRGYAEAGRARRVCRTGERSRPIIRSGPGAGQGWRRARRGSDRGRRPKAVRSAAVMKDDLAGGRLPSGLFGANAAWWAIMVFAHNLNVMMKRLVARRRLGGAAHEHDAISSDRPAGPRRAPRAPCASSHSPQRSRCQRIRSSPASVRLVTRPNSL